MNAPAEVRHVKRDDYYPMVRAFVPKCDGEELDCRAGLLLIRDRAMSTKRVASEHSWAILDVVQNLAGENAMRSMNLEDIKEIHRLAIRLVTCASGIDGLFAPPLPLEKGKE